MRILIDVDDVINNLCEAWIDWLNEKYGLHVCLYDMHDYNIDEVFPSLSKEQVHEPLFTKEFWETVKPKEDMVYNLDGIIANGHEVFFCTSTYYKVMKEKFDVLLQFLPVDCASWDNFIVTKRKDLINADMIVDDYVDNIRSSPCRYKVLFNAPHNYDATGDFIRVDDWGELYKVIETIDYVNKNRWPEWSEI